MQERTGGRIHIIVESEVKLGSESEVLEQIKYGGIAFARVSLSQIAEQAPEMNVLQLPYLYRDSENMKEYSGKTERNSPDRPPLPTELV